MIYAGLLVERVLRVTKGPTDNKQGRIQIVGDVWRSNPRFETTVWKNTREETGVCVCRLYGRVKGL